MEIVDRFALADGSYQHNLLRDQGRLDAFAKAIASVVRPGDVVADLGSGSGILAFLAARAGARRVFAVEANAQTFQALQRLIALNQVGERVTPVLADAETWKPPEPVHVVLCELMETGLLHEPMAAALRNVHAWPAKPRAVVPRAVRCLVEGVETPDDFLGYRAPLPGFRAAGHGAAVTDAATYFACDFQEQAPGERVEAAFALRATRPGRLHALRLRTQSLVGPGIPFEMGPGYCTPIVLPLAAAVDVREGQVLQGRLAYNFAFDARPLEFSLQS